MCSSVLQRRGRVLSASPDLAPVRAVTFGLSFELSTKEKLHSTKVRLGSKAVVCQDLLCVAGWLGCSSATGRRTPRDLRLREMRDWKDVAFGRILNWCRHALDDRSGRNVAVLASCLPLMVGFRIIEEFW